MKLNKFPLEIKMLIYEYFDPKNKMVNINKCYYNDIYYNRKCYELYIYIESEKVEWINLNNSTIINFRYKDEIHFDKNSFFLRKSQIVNFRNKLT